MAAQGFQHLNHGGWRTRFGDTRLGDNAFALMPWMVKPYSRRQLTREERIIANCRVSRGRRVVKIAFGILESRFRVLLGTMEQRLRVVRDIVFLCLVLYNMLMTHQGRADKAPTPINDVAIQQNKQAVYVPNEHYMNPSREAKHQREQLKDFYIHMGVLALQEDRI